MQVVWNARFSMTRPLHILIIDDDQDDTDFLMAAFSSRLPETLFTTVQNGQAALDLLLNITDPADCPDVAFLDLHMPGKSGYDVLKEIRAVEQCRDFPVMVISTSMLQSEIEKCKQAGCTGYFVKPASMEEYEHIVQTTSNFLHSKAG